VELHFAGHPFRNLQWCCDIASKNASEDGEKKSNSERWLENIHFTDNIK
jgi:hypothetical protein